MIRDGVFRKAGGSETVGCVEVAALPEGGIRVRDSKDRQGPVLPVTDDCWGEFIGAAGSGAYDLPA
ncbi:MAG TPA: DUF397 domain-containing protein [Streptosporangiaceae bacterium]|nr:DUF397 domain-containing protein [Streptosporangiaceae bacterium]